MAESLRVFLAPYYLYVKFVHLMAVLFWAGSTAVAYFHYVRASYLDARRNPEDAELKRRKDWALEQFDKGVVIEHVAFPVVLVSGLLLFWLGMWELSHRWLFWKLLIVVVIFIPMEIVDTWFSHLGGNKQRVRETKGPEAYEKITKLHWKFFTAVVPLIYIFIPALFFLATVRP